MDAQWPHEHAATCRALAPRRKWGLGRGARRGGEAWDGEDIIKCVCLSDILKKKKKKEEEEPAAYEQRAKEDLRQM